MRLFVALLVLLYCGEGLRAAEQCDRLFSENSERATCQTLLNLRGHTLSDEDLRELVSQQLYGLSATEAAAERKNRQERESSAKAEMLAAQDKTQCGRLFPRGYERDVCIWSGMFTSRSRTDEELRKSVLEHVVRTKSDENMRSHISSIARAIEGDVLKSELSRREAEERHAAEKVELARKAREGDEQAAATLRAREQAEKAQELAEARRIQDEKVAKERAAAEKRRLAAEEAAPIPATWQGFQASRSPADKRVVAAIRKMEWWTACREWGRERRQKKESRRGVALREFLLSDGTINGVDLMHVPQGKVAVGMSTCGVFASLGLPDKINRTTTGTSMSSQMIYRQRDIYVYTEAHPNDHNGTVRSIQD